VLLTLAARVQTKRAISASSQIESRGQLVRHASIVSAYVRGRASIHSSRSRVSDVTGGDVSITTSVCHAGRARSMISCTTWVFASA
jgi:hypothetical protein